MVQLDVEKTLSELDLSEKVAITAGLPKVSLQNNCEA
jgi:hypothetical protein